MTRSILIGAIVASILYGAVITPLAYAEARRIVVAWAIQQPEAFGYSAEDRTQMEDLIAAMPAGKAVRK